MKNLVIALLLSVCALSASAARADIIKCSFTEPFVTTEYSMAQQTLTLVDPVSQYPETIRVVTRNVSFQIIGPSMFELRSREGVVLQKLDLNFQGSDGMSELTFPYDVQWIGGTGGHDLWGGCSSNFLHAVEPNARN